MARRTSAAEIEESLSVVSGLAAWMQREDERLDAQLAEQTASVASAFAIAKSFKADPFLHNGIAGPLWAWGTRHARLAVAALASKITGYDAHHFRDTSCQWPNEITALKALYGRCARPKSGDFERFVDKLKLGGDVQASRVRSLPVPHPHFDAAERVLQSLPRADVQLMLWTYVELYPSVNTKVKVKGTDDEIVTGVKEGASAMAYQHAAVANGERIKGLARVWTGKGVKWQALVAERAGMAVEGPEGEAAMKDVDERVKKTRRAFREGLAKVTLDVLPKYLIPARSRREMDREGER